MRLARELHQAARTRGIYFRANEGAAVLVLECADVAKAPAALSTLPLVAAGGLIEFDVLPLRDYDGFPRLFSAGTRG